METTDKQSPNILQKMLYLIIALLVVAALVVAVPLVAANTGLFAGTRPDNLGIQNGQLAVCPNSPNCVSSYSEDAEHGIAPLTYSSNSQEAIANLKQIINSQERTKIVTENDNYLYAEFTSKIMGFVDDVEFYLDEAENVIHVRSASRLGQSDLGANRQRIETIRAKLHESQTNG